jgi:predicted transcriptional regulator
MNLRELSDYLSETLHGVSMDDVIKALEKQGNKVEKVGNIYNLTPKGGSKYKATEEELRSWYDRVSKLKKPAFDLTK